MNACYSTGCSPGQDLATVSFLIEKNPKALQPSDESDSRLSEVLLSRGSKLDIVKLVYEAFPLHSAWITTTVSSLRAEPEYRILH